MKAKKVILFLASAAIVASGLLSLSSCSCPSDGSATQVTLKSGESCPSYCSDHGYKKSQTVGTGTTQDCCCY